MPGTRTRQSVRPKILPQNAPSSKRGKSNPIRQVRKIPLSVQNHFMKKSNLASPGDAGNESDDSATAWARWPPAPPRSPSPHRFPLADPPMTSNDVARSGLYDKVVRASKWGTAQAFTFDVRPQLQTMIKDSVLEAIDERDSLSRTDSLIDQCFIDTITRNNALVQDMRQHMEMHTYCMTALSLVPIAVGAFKLLKFLIQR